MQFADLLERIVQFRCRYHGLTSTDRRQASILVQLAPQEQLVGVDAVAPGHHGNALSGLKALANHGQLLVGAPAATAFMAEQLTTLIVAVSHKHTRLPIPYLKGGTVSCLSWGSFMATDCIP